MLVLTEAAAEVVKAISSTPQAPEGSGLRIASPAGAADPGTLQVTAAPDQPKAIMVKADAATDHAARAPAAKGPTI